MTISLAPCDRSFRCSKPPRPVQSIRSRGSSRFRQQLRLGERHAVSDLGKRFKSPSAIIIDRL